MPSKLVLKRGIVFVVLVFLEVLLLISNNIWYLGIWERFILLSTKYRDDFRGTQLAHATGLDSISLSPYSLWRGWVVPSCLAASAYIIVSILTLRHELYHWKPELLGLYFHTARQSRIGKYIPEKWMGLLFNVYQYKHKEHVLRRIQKRKHIALQDSKEFLKVLKVVGFNIFISFFGVLCLWFLLLQTKLDSHNIIKLPRSYVPPVQGVVWYLINDFFYFYPHWIAHTGPAANVLQYSWLPSSTTKAIYKLFNQSHKLHHRTRANLGLAAWYCSPAEQVVFNLFPALIGPYLTQVVADASGLSHIWGTHLVTLYVWLTAAAASSVLAHTGYRSAWNDPGKHDLHHERAFNPKSAVNFGTMGVFDRLHGTLSAVPSADAQAWRAQHERQAALWEAARRSGVPLTEAQMQVVTQPDHSLEWTGRTFDDVN